MRPPFPSFPFREAGERSFASQEFRNERTILLIRFALSRRSARWRAFNSFVACLQWESRCSVSSDIGGNDPEVFMSGRRMILDRFFLANFRHFARRWRRASNVS